MAPRRRPPTQLAQNCSGKHAAMAATCVINGWPVQGYLDPSHPLQKLVAETVRGPDRRGTRRRTSTDGCGTPLFALTLRGMARAFGRLAAAEPRTGAPPPKPRPRSPTPCASTRRWWAARSATSPS